MSKTVIHNGIEMSKGKSIILSSLDGWKYWNNLKRDNQIDFRILPQTDNGYIIDWIWTPYEYWEMSERNSYIHLLKMINKYRNTFKTYKEYSWYNVSDYRDEMIDELVELLGEEEVIENIELEISYIISHPSNVGNTPPTDSFITHYIGNVLRRIRNGHNVWWY